MVDQKSSEDMDGLFDFSLPESASQTASSPFAIEASPAQPLSRRQLREQAVILPAVPVAPEPAITAAAAFPTRAARAKKTEKAARLRRELSRPLAGRRAVARASAAVEQGEPSARRLRRAEIAAMHAAAPKAPRKKPLSVLATMAVVGGLFAVAGLPAYALSSPEAASSTVSLKAQTLDVSADVAVVAADRDGYKATTEEELAQMAQDALRAEYNAAYLASGARAKGDDYPWPYELTSNDGGGLSPLNYYYRECVDFVAWRLNRDAGSYSEPYKWVWSTLTPNGGNASQWKYAWEEHGWKVSDKPVVGSVAWFGWSDHVSYVKAVNDDGTVLVEEYNFLPGIYGQRTLKNEDVDAFLYPPS